MTKQCSCKLFLYYYSVAEGFAAAELVRVDDTSVRVLWAAPTQPKGEVTGYFIYVDGLKIDTNINTPGSYLLTGLTPYTIFTVQV